MTKVELEKISDADMEWQEALVTLIKDLVKQIMNIVQNMIKKPKIYIKYLDLNNLYGKAVSEYLPYGEFKWVKVNNET